MYIELCLGQYSGQLNGLKPSPVVPFHQDYLRPRFEKSGERLSVSSMDFSRPRKDCRLRSRHLNRTISPLNIPLLVILAFFGSTGEGEVMMQLPRVWTWTALEADSVLGPGQNSKWAQFWVELVAP
jgi:hypothetical protein